MEYRRGITRGYSRKGAKESTANMGASKTNQARACKRGTPFIQSHFKDVQSTVPSSLKPPMLG